MLNVRNRGKGRQQRCGEPSQALELQKDLKDEERKESHKRK